MTPKISIVTPSFNQSRYLEETIRSVLGQNYPGLEYFVIDGGSTDGSVEIIKKYAQPSPLTPPPAGEGNVVPPSPFGRGAGGEGITAWISEKDKGQADAINKGFRRATGEIIAWLNSDDVYQPEAIQKAVEAFEKHPEAGLI